MLAILLALIAGPWPNVERAKWPEVAPIVAPTITVPADAKGRWENQKTCGQYGCVTKRVWLPDEEPPAEPQRSGRWVRKGLLRQRWVWVE